jgi:segregation and condensation protein A
VERQFREEALARLDSDLEAKHRDLEEAIRRRAALVVPSDYVPAAESTHEMYQVSVTEFAGPLDLLLFLIRRHEIDILDIPIAFICERYLEHVQIMQELNIDVAAEFMHMAAELMHIKSKMLLPRPAEVENDEEEVDPRAELVHRLLEYQKYKNAAMTFAGAEWLDRDRFERQPEKIDLGRHDAPLREVGVFALVEAFDAVLKRQKPELRHQVLMEEVSVAERIRRFIGVLVGKQTVRFEELIGELAGRLDIIVSFLALLEMAKFQLLKIYQSADGQLYVSPRYESLDEAMHHIEDSLMDDEAQYAG